MPEHVHLLLSEPEGLPLADALKSLKQGVSRRLIGGAERFWQKRYYDHNLRNYHRFVNQLRYVHRNPLRRQSCTRPEDWEWSSFRHYATGIEGVAETESEWTCKKADVRSCIFNELRLFSRGAYRELLPETGAVA